MLRPFTARVYLFYSIQRGQLDLLICLQADFLRSGDHSNLVPHAVSLRQVWLPAIMLV